MFPLLYNDHFAEIDEFKGQWKALRDLAPERLDALKKVATIEYAIAMTNSNTLSEDLILQTKDGQHKLLTLQEARAGFEKKYLLNLVKITEGNVTKAAELAGKYRADPYNLMKKHEISPRNFKINPGKREENHDSLQFSIEGYNVLKSHHLVYSMEYSR